MGIMELQSTQTEMQTRCPVDFPLVCSRPAQQAAAQPDGDFAEILFEQLDYLIQYADQESHRLERVAAILMETFN